MADKKGTRLQYLAFSGLGYSSHFDYVQLGFDDTSTARFMYDLHEDDRASDMSNKCLKSCDSDVRFYLSEYEWYLCTNRYK